MLQIMIIAAEEWALVEAELRCRVKNVGPSNSGGVSNKKMAGSKDRKKGRRPIEDLAPYPGRDEEGRTLR